jgi:hypothetical protein
MGITIHFSGRLIHADELVHIRAIASKWAAHWHCEVVDLSAPMVELIRVRNGQVVRYTSPVTGVCLRPHPDSEPLLLEFDSDLEMQYFCKTQFAPAQVHVEIVEMLRELAPHFEDFAVQDEGGYWETGDREHLEHQLALGLELIRRIRANDGALIAPLVEDAIRPRGDLKDPRFSQN